MGPGVSISLTRNDTTGATSEAGTASNKSFRTTVVVTLVALFTLVTIGGLVRATESGHDCPEWMGLAVETPRVPTGPVLGPLCGGDVSTGTFIELTHRVVAGIAALMVAWVVLQAWRHYRRQKWVLYPAILSFVLILAQAGLGGAAVLTELPRWSVMSHLAMAQLVIAGVLVVYAASGLPHQTLHDEPRVSSISLSTLGRWAMLSLLAAFVLLMAGSYVANTVGAGQGCGDSWPLCRAQFLPPLDHASIPHLVHRLLAILVVLPLAGLVVLAWRARSVHLHLWALALSGGIFFVAQIVAGASNIWFDFAVPAKVIHLSLATALLMSLTLLVLLTPGWFPQNLGSTTTERTQPRGGLPGAD